MSTFATVIEPVAPDGLSKSSYRFYNLSELDMVLDWVIHYNRPSKRHGWRVVKAWHRHSDGNNSMEREEPPQAIKDELRRRVNETLRFL